MTKKIGFALALALILPLVASAATIRTGETVSVQATPGQSIPDDVYAAGGTVSTSGNVAGDLYAAGGTVLVSGSVLVDAVIAGGTVTVAGSVGDDLRVGGGTIIVQGTVNGDVVAGGGQVHLAGRGIGGDVLAGGGIVRIDAPVGRDVQIGGGEVYINAPIAGNVDINAEKVTLGSGAVISGNFSYTSPREVIIEEGAQVRGQTTYTPRNEHGTTAAAFAAFFTAAAIVKVLMILAGALFFGLFFNRFSRHVVGHAFANALPELGRGVVVFILLPIISILLLVTVIGLPLGILGLLSFVAFMIFSCFLAPILLGSFIYQWFTKGEYEVNWKTILIGVLAFCVVGAVPIVGGIVQFAFMLLVLGTTAKLKWQLAKEWR